MAKPGSRAHPFCRSCSWLSLITQGLPNNRVTHDSATIRNWRAQGWRMPSSTISSTAWVALTSANISHTSLTPDEGSFDRTVASIPILLLFTCPPISLNGAGSCGKFSAKEYPALRCRSRIHPVVRNYFESSVRVLPLSAGSSGGNGFCNLADRKTVLVITGSMKYPVALSCSVSSSNESNILPLFRR